MVSLDTHGFGITLCELKVIILLRCNIYIPGGPMTVKPLQDRVLIKRVQEETKTAGGIIIPDNHKEKPAQGEVIAVGSKFQTS